MCNPSRGSNTRSYPRLTPSQLPQIYTMLCTLKITLVPQRVTLLFARPSVRAEPARTSSPLGTVVPAPVPVRCTQAEGRCPAQLAPAPPSLFLPFYACLSLCSCISRRAFPSPHNFSKRPPLLPSKCFSAEPPLVPKREAPG